MKKPKVQVLLSYYNGSLYIDEQVNSILSQEEVDVFLLIRDDGSTKEEYEYIANRYSENVRVFRGKNQGATNSFLSLIDMSDSVEYYSLSDQDDVWDSDKLIKAIDALEKYDCPALYCSNTRLVSAELEVIRCENDNPRTTLGSAIVKDYATGCTVVFNKRLRDLLIGRRPNNIPTHDWWINLVCLSCGGVSTYDVTPHMSYRQHGNNVVGAPTTFLNKWRRRWNTFVGKPYQRDNMCAELLRLYPTEISEKNKIMLDKIANYQKNKWSLLWNKRIKTRSLSVDILFWICCLFNKI